MAELELTRSPDDRRLYALEGVGTLRLEGWSSRKATAAAEGGGTWRIARRSMWRQAMEATDTAGAVVGEYEPRGALRRGGLVRWAGREPKLWPASRWRERYALADGDRELAAFDGKGWGKRPVKVTLDETDAVEAGLVLFAAFVVRGLAEDAGATAAGASAGT